MTVSRRVWVAAGIVVVSVAVAVTIVLLRRHSTPTAPRQNSALADYANRPVVAQGTGNHVVHLRRVRGPVDLTFVCLQKHMISIQLIRHGVTLGRGRATCDDGFTASEHLGTRFWPDTLIIGNALPDTHWTIFGAMTDRVG